MSRHSASSSQQSASRSQPCATRTEQLLQLETASTGFCAAFCGGFCSPGRSAAGHVAMQRQADILFFEANHVTAVLSYYMLLSARCSRCWRSTSGHIPLPSNSSAAAAQSVVPVVASRFGESCCGSPCIRLLECLQLVVLSTAGRIVVVQRRGSAAVCWTCWCCAWYLQYHRPMCTMRAKPEPKAQPLLGMLHRVVTGIPVRVLVCAVCWVECILFVCGGGLRGWCMQHASAVHRSQCSAARRAWLAAIGRSAWRLCWHHMDNLWQLPQSGNSCICVPFWRLCCSAEYSTLDSIWRDAAAYRCNTSLEKGSTSRQLLCCAEAQQGKQLLGLLGTDSATLGVH
jgi:hypothetical protein